MDRIFWATCPSCSYEYTVDHSLRASRDVKLECPNCRNKFTVPEAARVRD